MKRHSWGNLLLLVLLWSCANLPSLLAQTSRSPLVDEEIGSIKGIGALAVYDIAHRIGAYFSEAPERVYLHA